jgi:hypothetical protein
MRCEYDRHVTGLFSREVWLKLTAEAGFTPKAVPFEHSEIEPGSCELFIGLRINGEQIRKQVEVVSESKTIIGLVLSRGGIYTLLLLPSFHFEKKTTFIFIMKPKYNLRILKDWI